MAQKSSSPRKKTKRTFRSKFEQTVAEHLDSLGVAYAYEEDKLSYIVERNYLPDFKLPSGVYIEAKGYFKSADQRKHKLLKQQKPELDIRFVFQRMNGRVQGSKLTCAEWCNKHGFLYAEGIVPKEWL